MTDLIKKQRLSSGNAPENKLRILRPSYLTNVSFMFFLYWAVLVAWQNISRAEARSSVDVIIKTGLLILFVGFYLFNAKYIYKKILWVILFSISLMITLFSEPDFPFSILIAYVYPILILTMVYGFGDKYEIDRDQLTAFCNCVIIVLMFAAVYAAVFNTEHFTSALSFTSAYGNELASFFLSSHEYGMYLVYGIAACFICLRYKERRLSKRILYYIAIVVFLINLVLTFSRTSMLAAVLLFAVCILFLKNKKLWFYSVLLMITGIIVIISVPALWNFVYRVILKENNLAGRGELNAIAVDYFIEGTWFQKLFGHGVYESRTYFENMTTHGSVHNAYLQVLVYYGLIGSLSLTVFLISQFYACIREIKKDRFIGVISLGILVSAAAVMFTNTPIIFTSPIDSYFLTIFAVIVPKYVRNAINSGRFIKIQETIPYEQSGLKI